MSSLKPVSGAVEAGSTGATRDPPAVPAHKVQKAGPRSTPSPSPSSTAKKDPLKPKTSFNPQHTQAVETGPHVSNWHTSISPEAVSKTHTSSRKAKDSRIRGPSKDTSFTSPANTELSKLLPDTIQSSRVSSDQRSDIRSTLSPNAVASDSLLTHEEKHEGGVLILAIGTIRNPSSDNDHGQKGISPNLKTLPSHGSLPQESKYTQGMTTAEPGPPRLENLSDSDISTRNRNPQYQTNGNPGGPFTRVIADPLGETVSVSIQLCTEP